jgi:hypothetical protein
MLYQLILLYLNIYIKYIVFLLYIYSQYYTNTNIDTLQKLSFDEIYKDTKFNILPLFNSLDSFNLKDIVNYIYNNMLDKIDRNIPNYHFITMDTIRYIQINAFGELKKYVTSSNFLLFFY